MVYNTISLLDEFIHMGNKGLISNNVMITAAKEKANALAQFFSCSSITGIHWVPDDLGDCIGNAKVCLDTKEFNNEIELFELQNALENSKDTSPGGDCIPYFLLRALPLQDKIELLNICNQGFQLGEVLLKWKVEIVIY